MTAQTLITEHLDIWTSAHKTRSSAGRGSSNKLDLYGIKKLRELILELAVRGKLVPQDANDEPASELLKKIAAEKTKLVKEGKIKKEKSSNYLKQESKNNDLPLGWEVVNLHQLTPMSLIDGDWIESKDQDPNGEIRLIQLADIGVDEFKNVSDRHINTETFSRLNCVEIIEGDILIARLPSPIGRACIFPGLPKKAITVVDVAILRPLAFVCDRYLIHCINSLSFRKQVESFGKGATRFRISTGNLKEINLAIAPLPEQHRIVAKVDELMAFCDQLEQTQSDTIAAHAQLVEALLDTLTNSSDHNELQGNWQRIAAHFDTLFTTEHSIEQLKQTILQLAVMGKLVPQNPNDEPASELLKKIATEKSQLIKEGKIKKEKSPPSPPFAKGGDQIPTLKKGVGEAGGICDAEQPFELPSGWEWVSLNNLLPQFQNGASSRGDKDGKEVIVLRLADIKNWKVSLADTRTLKIAEQTINRYSLKKGDVLIIRVNGSEDIVGRFITCENDMDAIYCDHFIRMNFPIECIFSPYLFLLGSSELIRSRIANLFVSTAGQKTVNQTHIGSLPISLPPLAEQHRIVAKVDELMTLCDTLKTKLQNAQTTQLALADALVEQAIL